VLLVVPDAPWGAAAPPRHSSKASGGGGSCVGGVGSHGGSASRAAAAAAAAGAGSGDKGSSSQPQLNDQGLLLASYSLTAEYLAPLTGAVTLSSQQQAQQQVPNSSATNYTHAAGPARLPPQLALLPAPPATAAGSSSGWSGVGVGPFSRRQSLPLVLQCVTRSEVCRGSEAGLCGLAMSVFNKVGGVVWCVNCEGWFCGAACGLARTPSSVCHSRRVPGLQVCCVLMPLRLLHAGQERAQQG
jgi:hypothetical protein